MPVAVLTFDFKELEEATGNFADDRLLGGGGFAKVYHGTLSTGEDRDVAVKRWNDGSRAGEMLHEMTALASITHRNLLRVVGFASQLTPRVELLLVTPRMAKGSLHDALHDRRPESPNLDAVSRVGLLEDLARGLLALHNRGIVHRDVKSANVLIHEDGRAVLGDAGVARFMRADAEAGVTAASTHTRVIGTDAYIDPDYHNTSELKYESDIFSFGVVILEVLLGIRAFRPGVSPPKLWCRFRSLCGDDLDERVTNVVESAADVWSNTPGGMKTIEDVARIALRATSENPRSRPKAAELVSELTSLSLRLEEANSNSTTQTSPRECLVCREHPRQVRLDCGHMTTCEMCTAELHDSICPICRAPVSRWLNLEANPSDPTWVQPSAAGAVDAPYEVTAEVIPHTQATTDTVTEALAALHSWRDREDDVGDALRRLWSPAMPPNAFECVNARMTGDVDNTRTALHIAAEYGESELANLLVQAGGNVNSLARFYFYIRPNGWARNRLHVATPLWFAAMKGHHEATKYLLDAGAEKDEADDDGKTPLCIAAAEGHEAVVKCLVDAGADKDKADNYGRTPLWAAAEMGHEAVFRCLVDAGSDFPRFDDGDTSLATLARNNGHSRIAQVLERAARAVSRPRNATRPRDVTDSAQGTVARRRRVR